MSLYLALQTVENNKNKKSVKFQEDILNFCDLIQVFVFTTTHHLNRLGCLYMSKLNYKLTVQLGYCDSDVTACL